MMTTDRRGLGRAQIEELLPWHAAGTLGRDEAEAVEAALARDPELAARFELIREEIAETIHLNETLGAPSARAMEKLLAAIAADHERAPRRAASFLTRLGDLFSGAAPRALAWAGAAAAVVIVVQASLITGMLIDRGGSDDRNGATFEMSSYDKPAATTAAGTYALVRFVPQATADQITRALDRHNAAIVEGPKPGGVFRVRLADRVLPDDEADREIAALQAETAVIGFAARAQ